MTEGKLTSLITRRGKRGGWIYMLAAIPLLFFALWGWEYGAFFLYFSLAALCLIQYFYPTILGWVILFSIYMAGAATYLYVYFKDLFQLLRGVKSGNSIFIDWDDSVVFTILIALIVAIALNLYKKRPRHIEIQQPE
jgi:hypothetical protein